MLAHPILKGALCSPLMQLAAASAEPAPASCKRARPAATTGARPRPAKFVLFLSAFSVRECHLPDPGSRQPPLDVASPQPSPTADWRMRKLAIRVSISQRVKLA